ncbi:MAG: DMT family transporter [Sphaerochaetaceae bacterium]
MNSSSLSRPLVASLLASLCAILWGSAYPSIKLGYELFLVGPDDTPAKMAFAGLRFTLAGLLVLFFRFFQQGEKQQFRTLDGKAWLQIFLLGLLQTTIHYTFFYIGVSYTTGAKSSILNSSSVFFSALLAHWVYANDQINLGKGLGILLGFCSVIMVNLEPDLELSFTMTGEGFVVIAAFLTSASALYSKRISRHVDPVLLTSMQLFFGGLVLLIIALAQGASFPSSTLGGYVLLLYMAALSAVAFSIWTALLKYNKVSSITVFNFLIPVVGTLLSALVLGESIFHLQYLLALPLVVVGIILVTYSSSKTPV